MPFRSSSLSARPSAVATATRTEWLGRLEIAPLVAVGGFAGGSLGHVVGVLLPGLGGTLAENVPGCLALGFLSSFSVDTVRL